MPELPEVETVAAQLRRTIVGASVSRVRLIRPDYVRAGSGAIARGLAGRRIERIERHGKRMTCVLSPRGNLLIHLGMSGRVLLESADAPLAPHTHLVLEFEGLDVEARFRDPRRFGGVWFVSDDRAAPAGWAARLGPDALSIERRTLGAILARRRQVKAILMDQQMISGLGNIYCDEALFRAGIHPLRRGNTLETESVSRLARAIRTILREAVRFGGSTFREYRDADGRPGGFQRRHRVYARAGKPCVVCGGPIQAQQVAGRTTHFCPVCQPVEPSLVGRLRRGFEKETRGGSVGRGPLELRRGRIIGM